MKELKKQWKEHQFHKCYLFYGTETYLMKNYEEALVQALLPPGTESMNSDILEGKKATAATIMDAAETLPFLNDKRLVLIFEGQPGKYLYSFCGRKSGKNRKTV